MALTYPHDLVGQRAKLLGLHSLDSETNDAKYCRRSAFDQCWIKVPLSKDLRDVVKFGDADQRYQRLLCVGSFRSMEEAIAK